MAVESQLRSRWGSSWGVVTPSWVLEHAAVSLPEIEKATLRRVALRSSANVSRAATRLGMAPVSLSRWLARHKLATGGAVAR
jgi:hypothetical protein